jgi:hypothetical protein
MGNNKNSVDWLYEKLFNCELNIFEWQKHLEQAKAMHKEEIVNAYANGDNDGYRYMNNQKQEFEHGEQYYNEIYGGNK